LEKNDESEALKYINLQIEEYPKSVDAYALRARVFMEQQKYGSALTDINKAIKFWNKNCKTKQYSVYWWRAVIYSNMERYDKSFADFDLVYKLAKKEDPDVIHDVLYQRAQLHFDLSDYDYD
jgi:tetratricopeptide (TPR) repeat protein